MTFTSRSKFTVNRCMKMFVPISPPSPFSTNSGVDFHHSEFHRRLLKYQWYYITLRDSQCIASRYPFSIVSRKLIRWKFTRSITLFERFRVFKIKIRIDLEKKKKERSNHTVPLLFSTNISTNDLLQRCKQRDDSTIKKIVSPIIPKFSSLLPTSRDQFTTIKGD